MSDRDRVKSLLWRAASDGWRDGENVKYEDPAQGAMGLVSIVANTLLGRCVKVVFENGTQLVFEASERRILRFAPPSPGGLRSNQASLFRDTPVTGDDAGLAAATLTDLCRGSAGFRYSTEPISDHADPATTGISWQSLHDALGIDERDQSDTTDALDDFVDVLDPYLRAAVLISNDTAEVIKESDQESETLLHWYETAATRLFSADFPLFGTLETNGVLMFSPSERGENHILVAGRLGEFLLASVSERHAKSALDLWRKMMVHTD